MSQIYAKLNVSPKKKRSPPMEDESVATPKKMRTMLPPTPTSLRRKAGQPSSTTSLPPELARLLSIQSAMHLALSHSLATSATSPTSDTGMIPNVLNHLNLTAAAGFRSACSLDDLRRLCWLWEWDGKAVPNKPDHEDDEENPFVDGPKPDHLKDWTRGGMGLILTPSMTLPKGQSKRVPAYGIGIEVELDIDKDMVGGMAAVARWTSHSESRLQEAKMKLMRWVQLHADTDTISQLPLADLPKLTPPPNKQSELTKRLASLSPKSPKSGSSSSEKPPLQAPPSPTRSSPAKRSLLSVSPTKRTLKEFGVPFPITPLSSQRKSTAIPFPSFAQSPKTPSRKRADSDPFGPEIPSASSSPTKSSPLKPEPATPASQVRTAGTVPETPTSSRRAALYERIRKKSESQPATPSRLRVASTSGMSKDQLLKLGQEEMRRRCLLGRLSGVAESIWMLFSAPAAGTGQTPSPRKRRTMRTSEVTQAILKSSPVPISSAEAFESINLLASLCPNFLKTMEIGGEEWLELRTTTTPATPSTPWSVRQSPSRRTLGEGSSEDLKSLSPKAVRDSNCILREVRERIKEELEADG